MMTAKIEKPHLCQDYVDLIEGSYYRTHRLYICRVCREIWAATGRHKHGDDTVAEMAGMTLARLEELMEEE